MKKIIVLAILSGINVMALSVTKQQYQNAMSFLHQRKNDAAQMAEKALLQTGMLVSGMDKILNTLSLKSQMSQIEALKTLSNIIATTNLNADKKKNIETIMQLISQKKIDQARAALQAVNAAFNQEIIKLYK